MYIHNRCTARIFKLSKNLARHRSKNNFAEY